ncbi:MAG: c-type cytochrome [Actinobacteria bacterium]|nr:c-type cytochrome [Actinomycetota bacterium]
MSTLSGHPRFRGRSGPVVAAVVAALALAACQDDEPSARSTVATGNPELGRELLESYGCGSCHTIPGVKGADALVGPPLTSFAHRSYVAGQLANTPDNLARWIQDPRRVEPGTAMPDLGVDAEEARNMAAYLLQLD